jgi:hypothetical protein
MDVHKDSITIVVRPAEAKTPTRLERLPNDLPNLKKWIDGLGVGFGPVPVGMPPLRSFMPRYRRNENGLESEPLQRGGRCICSAP